MRAHKTLYGRMTALLVAAVFGLSTLFLPLEALAASRATNTDTRLATASAAPLTSVASTSQPARDVQANQAARTLGINKSGQIGEPMTAERTVKPTIKPRELVEKRTATSDTRLNADGSFTRRQYTESKYFKTGSSWQDIDTTIIEDKNAGDASNFAAKAFGQVQSAFKDETTFTIKANDWTVRFAPTNDEASMVRVQDSDSSVGFAPVGAAQVAPKLVTDKAGKQSVWYYDVWNGVDIEYVVTADSLKENILLKHRNAVQSVAFDVSGARLVAGDGKQAAYRIEGALDNKFVVAPFVISLNKYGFEAEQPIQHTVTGGRLNLSVDKQYLAKLPADAFPVTLDPTVVNQRSNFGTRTGGDYMSFKSDGYTCNSATCNPLSGTVQDSNGAWRTWRGAIKSPYNFMQGKKFISANLRLTQRLGLSTSGSTVNRYFTAGHATCLSFNCIGQTVGYYALINTAGDINVTNISISY